jgi:hypothetical protein
MKLKMKVIFNFGWYHSQEEVLSQDVIGLGCGFGSRSASALGAGIRVIHDDTENA